MKNIFFEDWNKKRVDKVISIFGRDWFASKKILELGACHGDIGLNFLKLGSDVTFSDARIENLSEIRNKLKDSFFEPKIVVIDQDKEYNLNESFDLVVHFATLSHLENWKNDLSCALRHTNLMLLETSVNPIENSKDDIELCDEFVYEAYNRKNSLFTQESVEDVLRSLGCKFIRLDSSDLNSNWSWSFTNCPFRLVYDWNYVNHKTYDTQKNGVVLYRRFWIVIK
jgi:hypothetical protein